MTRVRVLAKFEAAPGKREGLLEALRTCAVPTHQEAGVIQYQLTQSTTDPDVLVVVEEWKSQQDLDTHLATPHLKALLTAINGGLTRVPPVIDVLKDL